MAFMERVAPVVDDTIRLLAKVKFVETRLPASATHVRPASLVPPISATGESWNLPFGKVCATAIIFYYGVRSIPRPWSLVKNELDEHFGFPVVDKIEQANDYFRTRLHALLEAS
jgi:hypothetical protein